MAFVLTKYRLIFNKNILNLKPISCSFVNNVSNYSTSPETTNQYDIIIAGGGMVGTAFLLSLAKDTRLADKKILLLEGGPKYVKKDLANYSNRVSAINRGSSQLFENLSIWNKIRRKQPVNDMQIWDACSDACITFNDTTQTEVAYIIENDEILHALYTGLEEENYENITVLNHSKVKRLRLINENYHHEVNEVELQSGDKFSCNLLVGAEGSNSLVRREMGTPYMSWMYDQMGVVATLELEESPVPNDTAWQRFVPGGPVALLPLGSNVSSLVWSLPTDKAKALLALSDEDFVEKLNEALSRRYPHNVVVREACGALRSALRLVGVDADTYVAAPRVKAVKQRSRAAFPLGFGHSGAYAADGVALIGDAAHRVHPLAGQGVNLGFGDVSTLSTLIGDAIYRGADVGDSATLRRYETMRQRHAVPTMAAIEALHRLYETDATPVVLARSLGLQLISALSPVKKMIMQHAAGSTASIY